LNRLELFREGKGLGGDGEEGLVGERDGEESERE